MSSEQSQRSIERPVLYGFSEVRVRQYIGSFQIRNRARQPENAVVRTRAESQSFDRRSQKRAPLLIEPTVFAEQPAGHPGIAGAETPQPFLLAGSRAQHACADISRRLRGQRGHKISARHARHLDMQIEPVQQRAGDAPKVARDLRGRAQTFA